MPNFVSYIEIIVALFMGSYRILYGMEKIFAIFICALVLCGCSVGDSRPDSRRKVAVQTYSLHKYTLEEALEILAPMGIDGVECYPEQVLSKSMPEVRITPKMTKEQRDYLKSLFKKHNLKMASYGVCFGHNESGIREICEFAKDFGCGSVITEDREDLFPLWEKYADKYGLTVSIHHHKKDSRNRYYDADYMREKLNGYKHIKGNPDIGHLSLSGIEPMYYLKVLSGRIGSLHFKDQPEFGNPNGRCVPLGDGVLGNKSMLEELDRQGYSGYYVVEYEEDVPSLIEDIEKCVLFLRQN